MNTSDLKIMKEREASFLKAIDMHQGIIHKICHAWSRNSADEEDWMESMENFQKLNGSCLKLFEDKHCIMGIKEIKLNMNNSHAFLYKPYKEWVYPLVNWVNKN
jgi:hypothetical protein